MSWKSASTSTCQLWIGRHSLEIFAAGCLAALIGRILYRTFDVTGHLQIVVNLGGVAAMLGLRLP